MRISTALMVSVLYIALVPCSFAKSGNGNGNGNGNGGGPKPKPVDTPTTFVVGQVVCSDSRILDVSGDYDLTTSGTTVSLSITQDDRGRLSASATITLDDGSTSGPIQLNGHLQLTALSNLRLQLNGRIGASTRTTTDDLSMEIRGPWDGTAFQLQVKVSGAIKINQTFALTPVNADRGFTIQDGAMTTQGNPKNRQFRGNRTVDLPWGSLSDRATFFGMKKNITFTMHNSKFGIDLRGTVEDNTTFTATRAQIHLGYGELRVPASTLTVSAGGL